MGMRHHRHFQHPGPVTEHDPLHIARPLSHVQAVLQAAAGNACLSTRCGPYLQRRVPQHLLQLHLAGGVAILQQLVDHVVEHLGVLACTGGGSTV
jgi:hypothetical protein